MNKNKKMFLIYNKFLFNILFLSCSFFSQFKNVYATSIPGYLNYCGDGSNKPAWSNYPATPSNGAKFNCLNKRYCSDIKIKALNIGDFLRENSDSITFKTEIIKTTEGPCEKPSVITQEIFDLAGEKAIKTTTTKTVDKKIDVIASDLSAQTKQCITEVTQPLIFQGDPYTYGNGSTVNRPRPPILYTEKAENCYLKSCEDLTLEELQAINGVTFLPKDSATFGNFYKYCLPYKYSTKINMQDGVNNEIKILPITDHVVDNQIYCNEIEDLNKLKYLIIEGSAFDSKGNKLPDVFHCRLHQCSLSSTDSSLCKTNYYSFANKSDKYLEEYEKNILKTTDLSNPRRATYCTRVPCSLTKYTADTKSCSGELNIPSSCDKYLGLDNDLESVVSEDLKKTLGLQKCTSSPGNCIQTIDCGLEKNKNNTKLNCVQKYTVSSDKDPTLSYFYRPIPSPLATEDCYSSTNVKCADKIGKQDRIIRRFLKGETDADVPVSFRKYIDSLETMGWAYDYDNQEPYTHNYFRKDDNEEVFAENFKNICANNAQQFKDFGYYKKTDIAFGADFDYNWGTYYNGFGSHSIGSVHILPICDVSRFGANGNNREYTCGNSGYICNKPDWDSYYIKGEPIYTWKTTESDTNSIQITACLRQKNTGELATCGERTCRVDCAASLCNSQWCGVDRCVSLELDMDTNTNQLQNCSLEKLRELDNIDNLKCVKEVTGGLRFRLNRIGRKAYVFLDVTDTTCTNQHNANGSRYFQNMDNLRRGTGYDNNSEELQGVEKRDRTSTTYGGTFIGKMDEKSLLDRNDLVDVNGDGYITDSDVFGEYLFWQYQCNEEESTTDASVSKRKPECTTFLANNGANPPIKDTTENWVTWDIVQYRGNNQESKDKCKVGSIGQCRGFYDKDGKFFTEQQGMTVEMPTGPGLYYKYATIENSPDMFLPLLYIYSYRDANGMDVPLNNLSASDVPYLDFFTPKLTLEYGMTQKLTGLDFEESITTPKTLGGNTISTTFIADEVLTTEFLLEKIGRLYPTPQALICVYQILGGNTQQEIQCFKRKNPSNEHFSIMPFEINKPNPTFKAFFRKNKLQDLPVDSNAVNDNISGSKINFYSNPELEGESYKALKPNSWAYAHKYPIFLEDTYCSQIHYFCALEKKKLVDEVAKGIAKNVERLKLLEVTVSNCENEIDTQCVNLNGREALIEKIIKNDKGEKGQYIFKIKENYNTDGAFNQVCVTKGFEDYQMYLYAYPNFNGVLGKCNLIDESKNNPKCRRKEYYKFCNESGVDGCECLNGESVCDCSNNNCLKTIDCSVCPKNDCTKLDKECFLQGVNSAKTSLDKNGILKDYCVCQYALPDAVGGKNGLEKRLATSRELGLCADLRDIYFCDPVKYYDKSKMYFDGGEGGKLDYIEKNNYSNIWRTKQKVFGQYFFGNLGHSEFDKATDCDYKNDGQRLHSDFCSLITRCYNEDTGEKCIQPSMDCSKTNCTEEQQKCKCGKLQDGVCKGFWKQKTPNTVPLAQCQTKIIDGERYTMFELVGKTNCTRYSCPDININNVVLGTEFDKTDFSEKDLKTANNQGLFHGFAIWSEYKKASDLKYKNNYSFEECEYSFEKDSNGNIIFDNNGNPRCKDDKNYIENGYGDDIEERTASNCLQGYGPAGLNYILDRYIPHISNSSTLDDRLKQEDQLIKNMIGYGNPPLTNIIFKDYVTKTNYNAREHLPVRHCNQIGNWMPVNDLYSRFRIDLYNLENEDFRTNLDEKGFVRNVNKHDRNIKLQEDNNYAVTINYDKKYCERLVCKAINFEDIGLISVEESEPLDIAEKNYEVGTPNNKFYPNEVGTLNYPKDPTNYLDTRINKIVNNKNTRWRHAGGAIWSETPAPRSLNLESIDVSGKCETEKNFYPFDVTFITTDVDNSEGKKISLPSFQAQYDTLFPINEIETEKNLKKQLLIAKDSMYTEPNRSCSKWGVWDLIQNKCAASCEALDVFRTKFKDLNNDSKLQNHEITSLYKTPKYRNDYYVSEASGLVFGDKLTGGAKWPRIKSGNVALGECDATIGKVDDISKQVTGFPKEGVQFLRVGIKGEQTIEILNYDGTTKTQTIDTNGRPYRVCQVDGTWGDIQDRCVKFLTCKDLSITTQDLITTKKDFGASANYQILPESGLKNIINILTLNGGSINFNDIKNSNTGDSKYVSELSMKCNSNPVFEPQGEILKICDVTRGQWLSGMQASCLLKTCPAKKIAYGNDKAIIINVQEGEYYTKSSGYSGPVTLVKNDPLLSTKKEDMVKINYKGYEYTNSCPDGYICQNCENNNNKYTYTCDLNAEGNPIWQIGKGSNGNEQKCVPLTCNIQELTAPCNNMPGCTIIANKTIKTTTSNGSQILSYNNVLFEDGSRSDTTRTNFTYGTSLELQCNKPGYYENIPTEDIYATCEKTGKWNMIGGSCRIPCNLSNIPANSYSLNSQSGYVIPGTVSSFSCSGGYYGGPYNFTCNKDANGNGVWSSPSYSKACVYCGSNGYNWSANRCYRGCGATTRSASYGCQLKKGTCWANPYCSGTVVIPQMNHGETRRATGNGGGNVCYAEDGWHASCAWAWGYSVIRAVNYKCDDGTLIELSRDQSCIW